MATSFSGSLGQTNNYSSITDLITQWPTAAQNQGIQLSGIAFDGEVTNYLDSTVISNLTLATNENPKSWLSYGAVAGIGVPSSYDGWFTDITKVRAEINHDPNTNQFQALEMTWADNKEITSATIGLSGLLPTSGTGDPGNEAGRLQLFKNGAPVSASNFTITRLNPPATPKPIAVSSNAVTFIGDRIDGNFEFTIVGDSLTGATFDELRFSATALDSPTAAYLATSFKDDSSDYLVRKIEYQGISNVAPTSTSLFQFAQPNYTVAEGGAATINVIRTGGTEAASINYQTLDGSASSAGTAADYTSAAGLLNFAAGQTTASFTVTALSDLNVESAETVNLVLLGGNVSSPSILTINDVASTTVPPTPTTSPSLFQFAQPNYTVAEGGAATINVTRTGGTEAASINYQTFDGSASSAGTTADYTTAAGVLNFTAGQTTASFTVTALTDAILESAETVNLVLFGGNVSSPSILTINDVASTTVGPIPTPTSTSLFQFAQPNYTVTEGGAAAINVTRTGGTEAASINYQTLDGSASSAGTAADYVSAAGVLNFAAGQTTASFTVPALTDLNVESSPETVNLVLFGGNVSSPSILTINDVASTTVPPIPTPTSTSLFQFAQPNYTVAEGGVATINVTRTGGTGAASINYRTLDGSASSAGTAPDYGTVAGLLNFGAGQTTASFTVTALTDAILESSPETVNLVLLGGNVGSSPSILTINDVASTPTTSTSLFQFQQPNYTVAEGGVATINVTRTGGTGAASINYSTVDLTASSAGSAPDYTAAAGLLNFAAGQTTASFTVTALTDSILESPETVRLVLSGGNIDTNPSILTINDVAATPGTTPNPATSTGSLFVFSAATFTTPESSGFATVTVNRIGPNTAAGTIGYSTLDGTALSTGGTAADYASTAGVLNFGPGVTSTTFNIFVNADTVPEMTETVNLFLNNGPVSTPSTAQLQIIDSSGSASGNIFQYSASNYGSIATMGGSTTVTVTRSSGLGAASIDYIILAGTPAGTTPAPVYGTDYLLNPGGVSGGTLSFANGQLSQTFTIQDNPFSTNNGTVNLGLANPTAGYSFGSTAATSITLI